MPFAVVRRYCLHLHFHLNKYPYFWCFNAKPFVHIQVHILHNAITVLHLSIWYKHVCINITQQCIIIKKMKMFVHSLGVQKIIHGLIIRHFLLLVVFYYIMIPTFKKVLFWYLWFLSHNAHFFARGMWFNRVST